MLKDYSATNKMQQLLITTQKLGNHFSAHFNRPSNDPPDEVNNPQDHPHILTTDECCSVCVDEDPPSMKEISKTVNIIDSVENKETAKSLSAKGKRRTYIN